MGLLSFLVNIQFTHTHFPSCVDFAQPLHLLLHRPPLKQLLEKCRLCSVINRLHVCCDRVVFGFNELLQSSKSQVTLLEYSLINHFQLNSNSSSVTGHSQESWCTHQSSGHDSLSLIPVGFLSFPRKYLCTSLIQDVAVLVGLLKLEFNYFFNWHCWSYLSFLLHLIILLSSAW